MTHMAYYILSPLLAITEMKKTLKQKRIQFQTNHNYKFDLANIIFNSILVN